MGIFHGGRWTVLCCVFALTLAATPRKFLQNRFSVDYEPFEGPWSDDFDWGVIKEVLHKAAGNAVISPLSVKALLTLLYEGSASRSETERELLQALSGGNALAVSKLQADLLSYKQQPQQRQQNLLITDRVFHDVSVTIMQKYHSIIEARYNATTQAVDFQNTVAAAAEINQWIAQNTRGKIESLIKPDTLQDALMLLINTIYFKGSWLIPFPTNATVPRQFYTTRTKAASPYGGPRTVPFMKQRERIFYYKHSDQLGAQFLRLPYDTNQLSMIVVLPDEQLTLNQLLARLTPQAVHQTLADMSEEEVEIELPQFSITYSSSLRECLQQLGISRVFTDQAELPLISRGRTTPLKVSTILQKSCIFVDEQGTEASAATEGTLVFTILNQPIKFIANRPFLFLIYDEGKGNWLFAGKVEDPQE
uniref:Serpin domain-containing protein n=1 Tax=Anopheles epiroticus TaxID=199890 RepID=A0A240PKA4_9DIPT